ncbi:hypothetical protein OG785_41895 [Streptomyces sp. NBC_00006]|uniref:hypothetical protein n=1 Tax=Streptomyces sp. NBC_00006 TaxID=2975619 RepID=UPI002250236F|nr:hypothetical protein [Streptomyces sp. NBC_00006]MCX5537105.1 hypothetical protein [Streptomyces sp. NBC_00006]
MVINAQGNNEAHSTEPGTALLLAAAPVGKAGLLDAVSVLPTLAAVPPSVLTGTAAASVVELADPLDPQAVLTRLRTVAAQPGPLHLFIAGQLHLDHRQRLLHLALARTTPSTLRYTALPWHWLTGELTLRRPHTTTVVLDLVADAEAWKHVGVGGLGLGHGTSVFGRVLPPPPRRTTLTPTYLRAYADIWRTGARPTPPDLHETAASHAGPKDALFVALGSGYVPKGTPGGGHARETTPVAGNGRAPDTGVPSEPAPSVRPTAPEAAGTPAATAPPSTSVPAPPSTPATGRPAAAPLPPAGPAAGPASGSVPGQGSSAAPAGDSVTAPDSAPVPVPVPESVQDRPSNSGAGAPPVVAPGTGPAPAPPSPPISVAQPAPGPEPVQVPASDSGSTPAAVPAPSPVPTPASGAAPAPDRAWTSGPAPASTSAPASAPAAAVAAASGSLPNSATARTSAPADASAPGSVPGADTVSAPAASHAQAPAHTSAPAPAPAVRLAKAPAPSQVTPPPVAAPVSARPLPVAVPPSPAAAPAPAASAPVPPSPAATPALAPAAPAIPPMPATAPAAPVQPADPDPHALLLAAVQAGRHGEAASIAAAWEGEALRVHGMRSSQVVHWMEVRADLARLADEPGRSCELWIAVAHARIARGEASSDEDVEAAVDRAHHQWEQVRDPDRARGHAAGLTALREQVPGRRPGALDAIKRRLDALSDPTRKA